MNQMHSQDLGPLGVHPSSPDIQNQPTSQQNNKSINITVNGQKFGIETGKPTISVHLTSLTNISQPSLSFASKIVTDVSDFFKQAMNNGLETSEKIKQKVDDFAIPEFLRLNNDHTINDTKTITDSTTVNTEKPINYDKNIVEKKYEDLKEAVHNKNGNDFKNIFTNLNHEGKKVEAGELAKRLLGDEVDAMKKGSKENYQFIYKNLVEVYPKLSDFISLSDPVKGSYIIGSKGVDVIVADLKERGKIKCDVHTCVTSEGLPINDPTSINKMLNDFFKSDKKEAFFVVRHGVKGNHQTPLFIQKTENNNYRILVTDSTGCESNYNNDLTKKLKQVLNESGNKADIYMYQGDARQYDRTNCSVFAIRDIVQISKNSDEIFDWITKNGNSDEYNGINSFEYLPPAMMKTMQYLTPTKTIEQNREALPGYIKRFENNSVNSAGNSVSLDNYVESRVVRRIAPDGSDININFKVPKLFLKYQRMVAAEVIRQAIS